MAAFITGVITNIGREALAKGFGYVGVFYPNPTYAAYFRIGVKGYLDTVQGRIPKDPDPSLTDVEANGSDASNYRLQKSFSSSDVVFLTPSTIQFRCRLVATEGNDDGDGNNPRFFEIGIFDSNDVLIAYGTFDEQTKNPAKILTNYVQVVF
jgi:hypothetical protein